MNKRILKKISRGHDKYRRVILEFSKNNKIDNWDQLPQKVQDWLIHQHKKRNYGEKFWKPAKMSQLDKRITKRIEARKW